MNAADKKSKICVALE